MPFQGRRARTPRATSLRAIDIKSAVLCNDRLKSWPFNGSVTSSLVSISTCSPITPCQSFQEPKEIRPGHCARKPGNSDHCLVLQEDGNTPSLLLWACDSTGRSSPAPGRFLSSLASINGSLLAFEGVGTTENYCTPVLGWAKDPRFSGPPLKAELTSSIYGRHPGCFLLSIYSPVLR